jgi:hypothetical protein
MEDNMRTAALLSPLHLAGGLPGWMVFGDVIIEDEQAIHWDSIFGIGFFVILIIVNVVLWIRRIKRKAIDKEK